MSDLDDALRLACRARDSWRTLQGTVTSWTHLPRSMEAHRRANEGRGASSGVMFSTGSPGEKPPPDEQRSVSNIWIELPCRGRSETRSSGAPRGGDWESTIVVDGETFWMHDPSSGAITNNGDSAHQAGLGIDLTLLDPVALVFASLVESGGQTTVAGRAGMLLRLDPRPRSLLTQDWLVHHLSSGASEVVLDLERGVALSLTSLLDGQPYHRVQFTEIAFDRPIPPERLIFAAPAGEEIRDAREAHTAHEERPLHEIAANAGFVVLAAEGVRPGWTVSGSLMPARERPPIAETVHLFYGSNDGSVQINVNQSAAGGDDDQHRAPDGGPWRAERREGVGYRVWEPEGEDWPMARQVVFERHGTRVQAMSQNLDMGALLAFCATFAPASSEPSPPTL